MAIMLLLTHAADAAALTLMRASEGARRSRYLPRTHAAFRAAPICCFYVIRSFDMSRHAYADDMRCYFAAAYAYD